MNWSPRYVLYVDYANGERMHRYGFFNRDAVINSFCDTATHAKAYGWHAFVVDAERGTVIARSK